MIYVPLDKGGAFESIFYDYGCHWCKTIVKMSHITCELGYKEQIYLKLCLYSAVD